MDKEKQINEIADIMFKRLNGANFDDVNEAAVDVYEKGGYRKETQGEWVMRENKSPTQIEAYCSICGRDAVYQVIDNRWQFENYCPHCGACMKGE